MPGTAATGPLRLGARIGLCLFPVLSFGLLGMVPALVLAIRRRRPVDFTGAAVLGLLQLTQYVCLGLSPKDSTGTTVGLVGGFVSILLWLVAPAHFLLMDLRRVWYGAARPADAQLHWQPTLPAMPAVAAAPAAPAAPAVPAMPPSVPAPAPAAGAPADELQQLGELLRRQAREDGR